MQFTLYILKGYEEPPHLKWAYFFLPAATKYRPLFLSVLVNYDQPLGPTYMHVHMRINFYEAKIRMVARLVVLVFSKY